MHLTRSYSDCRCYEPPRKLSTIFQFVLVAGLVLQVMAGSLLAVEIVGHRGASYDAPENTLSSVNLAWQNNADAVEIDVFLTADGEIVAYHDKDTKRIGGRDKLVKDQTLAELQTLDVGSWKAEQFAGEKIPTLAEVVATIPDGKRLFIEIKCGPEILPELKRVLAQSGKKPEQTAVIGFSYGTMKAAKRELPQLKVYWVVYLEEDEQTGRWEPPIDNLIGRASRAELDGLDLGKSPVIDKAYVDKVKHAGLEFYVWTVNSIDEARQLVEAGVDGITTDRPGWLREQLPEKSQPALVP